MTAGENHRTQINQENVLGKKNDKKNWRNGDVLRF